MAIARGSLLITALICSAAVTISGSNRRSEHAPKLNRVAFDYALYLINESRFIADHKGAWSKHHPSRVAENDFIRRRGFAEYAKWYSAIDERHTDQSKARFKFPFGDFQNVHRCGLLAVKRRAREYGYDEIEAAADKLLEMIDSAVPRAQKRVDQLR